ncbi:ATP-binding cassette domain-containing protein [Roseateles asaccharophilus]|uniref:Phosphonate transport system ATP-binding protein n=1 Tax=Roseateles asaccharophilus TaxID=582607 RepID=A0ABU2A3N6_9BURK|nr:ATP-binding cassette domain-containing protein [Roseateles asaccharophilus]MDR7331800.1 phosphonate transport system ATP-binding protein [Roseateles asaccharophilus]
MIRLGSADAAALGGAAPVLHGIDLALAAGEQIAVIGASGAGKTTLLSLLALMQAPLAGRLELDGTDPWAQSRSERQRLRAGIALAPQQPPLPPRQRVAVAVLAARLPGMSLARSLRTLWSPPDAPLAQAALEQLGVADKLWQRVDRLSGGERQRVGLARLLVSDARLWLADEPLAALDPARAEMALTALRRNAAERGAALVCSLHQVDLALKHFPRVVALRAGRIVFDGPPGGIDEDLLDELYRSQDESAPELAPLPQPVPLPQAMCR